MPIEELELQLPLPGVRLQATVSLPDGVQAAVIFAHGSGSNRNSTRNRTVARVLQASGIGTVLFDLLTEEEAQSEHESQHLRFDLELLGERLGAVAEWLSEVRPGIRIGYFGVDTGAAAALVAAARHRQVEAVVSRSGRPDLAGPELKHVRAATLLVAGGDDLVGLARNHDALKRLGGRSRLEVIPNARFLAEEPGAMEEVARLAAAWFVQCLSGAIAADARA